MPNVHSLFSLRHSSKLWHSICPHQQRLLSWPQACCLPKTYFALLLLPLTYPSNHLHMLQKRCLFADRRRQEFRVPVPNVYRAHLSCLLPAKSIRLSTCQVDTHPLEKAAELRNIPLNVLNVAVPEAPALYGRSLVLVRPDQYIAWRGDVLPEDCETILNQVCGH